MTAPRKHRRCGYGELEKRASGSVRARHVGPDRARHQRTFGTALDAETWLVAERKLIDTDAWTPPRTRTRVQALTVAEYAVGNVATRTLAPRTAEEHDRYLERFVAGADLGQMPLRSVTPADVVLWVLQLRKDTGQVLAARVYGLVSSVFNAAVADGLVEHSPCRVRGATNAPRQSPKTAATPAEVTAVLAHLPANGAHWSCSPPGAGCGRESCARYVAATSTSPRAASRSCSRCSSCADGPGRADPEDPRRAAHCVPAAVPRRRAHRAP